MIELIKACIFGIVEGISEWLPISSTGHMILLNEVMPLNVSEDFLNMFLIVIQLGAIFAVVLIFWNKIFPFDLNKKPFIKKDIFIMWYKIIIACIPAIIIELAFGDYIDLLFYNYVTVATMLILVGIAFIIVENWNAKKTPKITNLEDLSFKLALYIGIFQVIAAVFPGTSRSGATIIGALLLGISRPIAAEFTFFLAIPVMFGASLMEIIKFGFAFSTQEILILSVGMIVSFIVSILVIKFLMSYIKKHDFKIFGWYRIILGIVVFLISFF